MGKKVTFFLFLVAFMFVLRYLGLWDFLEFKFYDFCMQAKLSKLNSDIVIVALDDSTLTYLGKYPLPRSYYARVINTLTEAKAKVIGLDIIFSSESTPKEDEKLACAIKSCGRVILSSNFFQTKKGRYVLKGINFPIKKLREVAAGVGFCNMQYDSDGYCRRLFIIEEHQDKIFLTLPILLAKCYKNINSLDEFDMPLIDNKFLLVNFNNEFVKIPFYQVLEGKIEKATFENKIVLIGATSEILQDIHLSPIGQNTPGVEIIANATANLINKDYIKPISKVWQNLYFIVICFIPLQILRLKPIIALACLFVIIVLHYLGNIWFFLRYSFYNEFISPIGSVLILYTVFTVSNYFSEYKERRRVYRMFTRYMDKRLVEEILASGESELLLGSSRQKVTILFADIRNFTTLAESLPASETVTLLNEYFSNMVDIIFKYNGIVDKFIGDCIMAIFGIGKGKECTTRECIYCSLEMVRISRQLMQQWQEKYNLATLNFPFRIGIGINTGEVVVGNIGSPRRLEYTVIGDAVNVAARIEQLTKEYNCDILITETTRNELSQDDIDIDIEKIGEVQLRGKKEKVKIYSVKRRGLNG